jgi:hypothetical protein
MHGGEIRGMSGTLEKTDSKSGGGNIVLVRVRPGAPRISVSYFEFSVTLVDVLGFGHHRVITSTARERLSEHGEGGRLNSVRSGGQYAQRTWACLWCA